MGSSDTEVNALAVMPCTSPSRSTVITVTPVAKHPSALRNSPCVKVNGASDIHALELGIRGRVQPLPFLPRHAQSQLNLAWIENRARRAIGRAGRTLEK